MKEKLFPPLKLDEWRDTRDTLRKYCRMLGSIREKMSKPHPHWWHISLRVSEKGLTTTPIPKSEKKPNDTFEMILDLVNHKLIIESNYREMLQVAITGQSLNALCNETCSLLKDIGINITHDDQMFNDGTRGNYDPAAAKNYWKAITGINRILNRFRDELKGERSPVQLWPHHFDMSMSWFTGRLVPGKDPDDAEASKEQMMFGFSTGDDTIPDAYFYILAYPTPEGISEIKMPEDSYWNTDGFQGGVMMYEKIVEADNAEEKLLNFFRTVQSAGAALMK